MIQPRRSKERGYVRQDWLESLHTFSFATYYDHRFMGFRALRVINEDKVQPGEGFDTHSHKDMEIISYVIDGELEHKDSMGNGGVIRPGDIQYMSAGSGVTHSEFNPSPTQVGHFLQIWILPNELGAKPRYGQKTIPYDEKHAKLRLLASPDGEADSITIRQDTKLYASILEKDETVSYTLKQGRYAWLQVVKGEVLVNGEAFGAGDAAAITEEYVLSFRGMMPGTEFLLFDLA